MKEGGLWLSILKTQACPSPMSITPAFSPGPWITHGALVGRLRRCTREDLYEQCSFHIAEKMPSSVKVGVRPISARMRSYSSGFSPCEATSSGVISGSGRVTSIPCRLLRPRGIDREAKDERQCDVDFAHIGWAQRADDPPHSFAHDGNRLIRHDL